MQTRTLDNAHVIRKLNINSHTVELTKP